ncbi:hypothetical protein DPMN_191638 [Dreissena polymorpha]|uniref:Uncharacterized protein n=1 Tax=Dreissena polymorpha TaxID=45954 RepID=A0A9D4BG13_DREPO|nr:hypothetical protein DPMN_191638 [Dreissena polymorpha]
MSQSQLFECVDETLMIADYTDLRDYVFRAQYLCQLAAIDYSKHLNRPVKKEMRGKKGISGKCEQLPEDPKRIRSTIVPATPPPTSILKDQHVSRLRKAKNMNCCPRRV